MIPSRWSPVMKDLVTEVLAAAGYGQELTYAELGRIIGLGEGESSSVHGRSLIYRAVNASKKLLLRDHYRVIVSVRGSGYRVAMPNESASIAMGYRDSADRKITRAVETLIYTDEREMTQAELRRHHATRTLILDLQSRMHSAEDHLNLLKRVVFGTGEQVQVLSLAKLSKAKRSRAERSLAKPSEA